MRNTLLLTAALSTATMLAMPSTTRACSCLGSVQLRAPSEGASDVALNIAPLVTGSVSSEMVEWTTAAGVAVPFSARQGALSNACRGNIVELIPQVALTPATEYIIRAYGFGRVASDAPQFRFTTGRAKVEQASLPEPTLAATIVRGRAVYDSCVNEVHGCLSVGAHETEVSFLGDGDELLSWLITSGEEVMERSVPPATICMEARTRDLAGRRSAPVRRCGSELGQREARTSDYDNYRLRCSGGRILDATLDDASARAARDASGVDDARGGAEQGEPSSGSASSADSGCSAASPGAAGWYGGLWLLGWAARRGRRLPRT